MTYTRFYSADDGESHFEDLELVFEANDYAPPAPPLNLVSVFAGGAISFHESARRMDERPAPVISPQLFFVLSGEWEVTASDGETRRFSVGSALLVEDTTGKGHSSRVISEMDSLAAMVQLSVR